jgi:hypothetical protein
MESSIARALVWAVVCPLIAGIAIQGGVTRELVGGLLLVVLALGLRRVGRRSAGSRAQARSGPPWSGFATCAVCGNPNAQWRRDTYSQDEWCTRCGLDVSVPH